MNKHYRAAVIGHTGQGNYGYGLDIAFGDLPMIDLVAVSFRFEQQRVGNPPFAPQYAPVVAYAKGRRVPGWGLQHSAAAPPPLSPIASGEPLEEIALIPYGCTNLRVTEFPVLAEWT